MNNKEIIKILKLTASLLELYGENQFKVRSYQTAVYNLERTAIELSGLDKKALSELPGVGKSITATIEEINQTGTSNTLNNLLKQTPEGILELLKVKGLGARKIKTAWDHLGVECAADLHAAATSGQLADLPGFGAKTQEKVLQILEFNMANRDLIHYKEAHLAGMRLEQLIKGQFPDSILSRTGAFRRKEEVVAGLEYLWATTQFSHCQQFLDQTNSIAKDLSISGPFRWRGEFHESSIKLDIRFCRPDEFGSKQVYFTGSELHLQMQNEQGEILKDKLHNPYKQEQEVYRAFGYPVFIPELREGILERELLKSGRDMDNILRLQDIKGLLHNHSTYSDGKNSLLEMAESCKDLGYQYFGITDHSQTAVYANGLDEEKVKTQHDEIDRINRELAPFKVFKGIESDILNDGSLDYPSEVLGYFDFVVASVHFNINMDEKQATTRLIKAIENPYTTILGHPTGRQLLKRAGYPIDHLKVIDACSRNGVVIEINAHPWRLDLDWRWVHRAVDRGVMISINPDAHEIAGLQDVLYGVSVARKAALPADMTLNAMGLGEIQDYFKQRKGKVAESAAR